MNKELTKIKIVCYNDSNEQDIVPRGITYLVFIFLNGPRYQSTQKTDFITPPGFCLWEGQSHCIN